jgi:L-ascorbate metabolism protein UlaG (beta-lactamase superfamily)
MGAVILQYFGDGCFRAQSGELSLLTNPSNNRFKANVTLRTLIGANVAPPADEIAFPGEYEIGGIEVRGWSVPQESTEKYLKTVYLVTWEDIRLLFLGHLSSPLDGDMMEDIAEPDVLFLPVGDHFLSAADAAKLSKKIEPAIVIPSFAKNAGEFLKAMGQKAAPEEKFVFKKKDLAGSKGRVVVLEAK